MSYEVILVRANHVTQELTRLATFYGCHTREEAEARARDFNELEDLDKDEFWLAIERGDEEDEDE